MPSHHITFKYGNKSTISQCLALAGVGFVQIYIGIQLILIGAPLRQDEKEGQTWSIEDKLWFGSFICLCMLLGCALSTMVLNRLGHIYCMIIFNVSFITSCNYIPGAVLNINSPYAISVLPALSIGFASGPFTTYVGEVCEPKLRGALMSCTYIFFYLIPSATTATSNANEKILAVMINQLFPVLTILILLMSPDSPIWLLTKGKTQKAKRTLGMLRGWIPYDICSSEFQEMTLYTGNRQIMENDTDLNGGDDNTPCPCPCPCLRCPWRQLLRPEVYRPSRLLMIYFFFTTLLSGVPISPSLKDVFLLFGEDLDVEKTIKLLFYLSMLASILTVFSVNKLGKRFITLFTMFICAFCYVSIGLIGSFRTNLDQMSWLMLILYLIGVFVSAFGILPISWALLTEVFPMKSRHITCGIGSTLHFIFSFFMINFFQDLLYLMEFNYFYIMGVAGLFGFVYFYFYFPETENKTLQDITLIFK